MEAGNLRRKRRRFPKLEPAVGGHHVAGPVIFFLCLDQEVLAVQRLDRSDGGIERNRKLVLLHVAVEAGHQLIPGHKAVRVRPVVFSAGELKAPVGRYECERIPALVAPGIRRLAGFFEDYVLAPLLLESITGR